ncbi:hypothetical protein RDWZM_008370 [Blomia tropicalis]|uniref:Uncharacterized protein n=1 Tax=Blomia tropicalis TaxID=40697 RepID=A0A9Q0M1Y6_BLOTA|nr:hypothetical protein RDWZM_008370 [Blomia tropicalis]
MGNCQNSHLNLGVNDFVPECTPDGNYKAKQCDKITGHCFCVDEITGKPNHRGARKNDGIECSQFKRQNEQNDNNNRRRKPKESPSKNKGHRSQRCNPTQRVSQIKHMLLHAFKSVYQPMAFQGISFGIRRQPTSTESSMNTNMELRKRNKRSKTNAIEQKFAQLDADNDRKLTADEFKYLSDFSRSGIPSLNGCANSLYQFCDSNRDLFVDFSEFLACFNPTNTIQLQEQLKYVRRKSNQKVTSSIYALSSSSNIVSSAGQQSDYSNASFSDILLLNKVNSEHAKNGSRLDCFATRANLEQSSNSSEVQFIPTCTADGHYEEMQCMPQNQLCWCVNPITGQSNKAIMYNATTSTGTNPCREIKRKGCDQQQQDKFHIELRKFLSDSCDSIFHHVDINSDRLIDTKEWKTFKKRYRKSLKSPYKKCFRSEMQMCDQNKDHLISGDEWVRCCNNNNANSERNSSPLSLHSVSRSQMQYYNPTSDRIYSNQFQQSQTDEQQRKIIEAIKLKKNKPRKGKNPLLTHLQP